MAFDSRPLTPGQLLAVRSLLGTDDLHELYFIAGRLLDEPLHPRHQPIVTGHWQALRDRAYPHWQDRDWNTLSPAFRRQLSRARRLYLEDELGQGTLFPED